MTRRALGVALAALSLVALYHGSAFAQITDFADDFIFRVPEPDTLTLFGSGLAALAGLAWFRRR